jgi:DNA-binding beta-propeller fold protein YncE
LAVGVNPATNVDINPNTHTLYTASVDTNRVWVLDASKCNAMHTQGMGGDPVMATVDPRTATVYVVNDDDGTVSLFPSSH